MHASSILCPLLWYVSVSLAVGADADRIVTRITDRLPATLHPLAMTVSDPASIGTGLGQGSSEGIVPAGSDGPFDTSREVVITSWTNRSYDTVAHSRPLAVKASRGDRLLGTVWLRAPKLTGGRTGSVFICLERSSDPWTAVSTTDAVIGPDWRQVVVHGLVAEDFPAGGVHLSIHLSRQPQTIELGGMALLNLGHVGADLLPTNQITYAGMEPDAPWRAAAAGAIERHRMATLAVHVIDSDGRPVTGASVTVAQVNRGFFGSCAISSGKDLILADDDDGHRLRDTFLRLFDRATVPLYWADWGWPSRRESWLRLASWARDQGLVLRGHPLVYPGWNNLFMPTAMEEYRTRNDPQGLQRAIIAHIREMGQAFAGIPLREIDVTNELRDLTAMVDFLGGADAVAEWFAAARMAFPGTKLCLNENSILTNGGNTDRAQDNLIHWYQALQARGQAPDVLGFQGHFGEAVTPPERVTAIIDRFAKATDAEFQITEFDLNTTDDRLQAAYLRDFMTIVFAHPRVTAFTMWGFQETDHWIPQAAFWRKDWSPRPAALELERLLGAAWRTKATLVTDVSGTATVQAFHGTLAVSATAAHGKATVMVQLDGRGTATILRLNR